MIIKTTFTFLFSFIMTQFFANQIAFADSDSKQLTRNSHSAMELSVDLTKDIYRSEAYESEYTVEVPYQVEETYYIDIPYEETESYSPRLNNGRPLLLEKEEVLKIQ